MSREFGTRDKSICKDLRYYIDMNIYVDTAGVRHNNKVGLVQDLYDFILLDNIEELKELRKCKEALEAMRKCPLIIEAGFVPYIESVLGLRDDYVVRDKK